MMEFAPKPTAPLSHSTVNVQNCTQDKAVTLKGQVIKLFWISPSALHRVLSKKGVIMEKTERAFHFHAVNR